MDCDIPSLQDVCLNVIANLDELLISEPSIVYVVFADQFGRSLDPERQAIMISVLVGTESEDYSDIILEYTNEKNMNVLITTGRFAGETLAFNFARSDFGKKLLIKAGLASMISTISLNHIVKGRHEGQSVAFHLIYHMNSTSSHLQEMTRFCLELDRTTLNYMIESEGPYQGMSVAILLASTPAGRLMLMANEFMLLSKLLHSTVNDEISMVGPSEGLSVAFILLSCHYSLIFSEPLSRMVTAQCFNRLVRYGPFAGQSVALLFCQIAPELCFRYNLLFSLSQETLNHIVPLSAAKEYAGTTVALFLTRFEATHSSQQDCYISRSADNLRKLCTECINQIVPTGKMRGLSVAQFLACLTVHMPPGGEVFHVMITDVFPRVTSATLNALSQCNLSVAAALASSVAGKEILAYDNNRLARVISIETLNAVHSDSHMSCAFHFAFAGFNEYHYFFTLDNSRLLRSLNTSALNSQVVSINEVQGWSVALMLAYHLANGYNFLVQDDNRLPKLIDESTLNSLAHSTPSMVLNHVSVAFVLSLCKSGLEVLCSDEFRLANMISAQALNAIVPVGMWYEGMSLALTLSSSRLGKKILSRNDYKLAVQISASTLNHIVEKRLNLKMLGNQTGKSVAFCLATDLNPRRNILAAHNYHLASMISAETLNAINPSGSKKHTSVAWWLACMDRGSCLVANDYKLMDKIDGHALNFVTPGSDELGSLSVAQFLAASTPHVFTRNNYRMAMLLTPQTMNHISTNKGAEGRSVAFLLSYSLCEILVANNFHLAAMVDGDALNRIVSREDSIYMSMFMMLCQHPLGPAILCSHGMRLAKFVTRQSLLRNLPWEVLHDAGCSDEGDVERKLSMTTYEMILSLWKHDRDDVSSRQELLHFFRSMMAEGGCDIDSGLSESTINLRTASSSSSDSDKTGVTGDENVETGPTGKIRTRKARGERGETRWSESERLVVSNKEEEEGQSGNWYSDSVSRTDDRKRARTS